MMFGLAVQLLLSLPAQVPLCSIPTTVVVDFDAPPHYDRMVLDAIRYLNSEGGGREVLTYGGRRKLDYPFLGAIDYIGVRELTSRQRGNGFWRPYWFAWAGPTYLYHQDVNRQDPVCLLGRQIWIDEQKHLRRHVWHRVMLHEIGHGVGLEHTSDPKCLMYSYPVDLGTPSSLGDAAKKQFQEWYR